MENIRRDDIIDTIKNAYNIKWEMLQKCICNPWEIKERTPEIKKYCINAEFLNDLNELCKKYEIKMNY